MKFWSIYFDTFDDFFLCSYSACFGMILEKKQYGNIFKIREKKKKNFYQNYVLPSSRVYHGIIKAANTCECICISISMIWFCIDDSSDYSVVYALLIKSSQS